MYPKDNLESLSLDKLLKMHLSRWMASIGTKRSVLSPVEPTTVVENWDESFFSFFPSISINLEQVLYYKELRAEKRESTRERKEQTTDETLA